MKSLGLGSFLWMGAFAALALPTHALNTQPPTFPAEGAWTSGNYRNLFVERGYTQSATDSKVNSAFNKLFFGDSANEAIYRVLPEDTTMAFIEAVDSKDIRTEGVSYGMTIAVMMDRRDVFDKLWKFAKTKMQNTKGSAKGYFAWQVSSTSPYKVMDPNPAPDGEEYLVTSLFLASKRWGNGTGIFQYQNQADSLLTVMITPHGSLTPLIDTVEKKVVFSPATSPTYTDPSYHLPAFYRLWSAFSSHHNALWREMADTSYAFLARTAHPTTGLAPEYAAFDGTAQETDFNANSAFFAGDAHRVGMNIGVDWSWFKGSANDTALNMRMLKFFASQTPNYYSVYTLSGTAQVTYLSQSLIAANGVAFLASNRASDWTFVDRLWSTPISTGEWRYYNGLVQMLSLLHASGKFKAYGSPGTPTSPASIQPQATRSLHLRQSGRDILVPASENASLLSLEGRRVLNASTTNAGTTTLRAPQAGIWIVRGHDGASAKITVP
ncbi:MAG: hypothetical protein RL318_1509 [Fibrobacterota bacterium]|jgi:endo-1,4-beta-D-glucanase Y